MDLLTPFEPRRFLELANILVNDKKYDEDCRSRTVVGRAYYGAFLVTRKKMQDFGISLRDVERIHKKTIEALQKYDYGLSSKLETLFRHRVDADYKMEERIDLGRARSCLQLSEHIINRIDGLREK